MVKKQYILLTIAGDRLRGCKLAGSVVALLGAATSLAPPVKGKGLCRPGYNRCNPAWHPMEPYLRVIHPYRTFKL